MTKTHEKDISDTLEQYFHSRIVIPAWLATAYEYISSTQDHLTPYDCSVTTGLLPALNCEEMEALIQLLGAIQQQLIKSRHNVISLNSEAHTKHSTQYPKTRRFAHERFLQQLPHLQLLVHSDTRGSQTVSLFQNARVSIDPKRSRLNFEMGLTNIGEELLLGFCDMYEDMHRRCLEKTTFFEINQHTPPVFIQKSAWLELKKYEQLLLLRFEKYSGDDTCLLQLDGTVGVGIDRVLESIQVPLKKSNAGQPPFVHTLHTLQRIGTKLQAHGVLKACKPMNFMALRSSDNAPQIVWLPGMLSAQNKDQEYIKSLSYAFLRRRRRRHEGLLAVLGARTAPITQTNFRGSYLELIDRLEIAKGRPKISNVMNNKIFLTLDVFSEMYLRSQSQHLRPLPDELGKMEFIKSLATIKADQVGDLQEAYDKFAHVVHENSYLLNSVLNTPNGCLAMPLNWQGKDFRDLMSYAQTTKKSTPASPPPIPVVEANRAKAVVATPHVVSPRAKRNSSINMLKVATEELNLLRHNQYFQYSAIKNAYITSLDNDSKQIILDIQKRMQPDMFDDHLRDRLVHFMIENPSAWKSTKSHQSTLGSH